MKIMIVTPYFYPKVGGLENYALNIAKGLKQQGHEVLVVTSNHEGKNRVEDKVQGIRVIRLPLLIKLSNTPINPAWRWQLKKIIKAEKPDVINAHTPVPFIADMAERVRGKTPFVLTYHNDLVKASSMGSILAKTYNFLFTKRTLRNSDSIIATSQYYANTSPYLKKWKSKIKVISPGVDITKFNNKVDKKWLKKEYPDKKLVLFVGSMEKTHTHKGVDVLIRAVAKAKKTIPNIHLIAVGSGDAISDYQALARQCGIETDVSFTGFIPDKELPLYYAGADVFVLPSTTEAEGFGMVLAEAQACGTPVIGSKVGGIPFVVENMKTGILVTPGSVDDLKNKLTRILTDSKLRARLINEGQERALSRFEWRNSCSATSNILSRAVLPKVCIVHNIISPYRLPVYEEVNRSVDLTVLFCKPIVKDRVWTYNLDKYSFKHETLKGFSVGPIIFNTNALKALRKAKFDVIMANSDPDIAPTALLAFIFAKLKSKKIVISSLVTDKNIHFFPALAYSNRLPHRLARGAMSWFVMLYRKLCFAFGDHFLAFSEHAQHFLEEQGVRSGAISRTYQVMAPELLLEPSNDLKRDGRTFLYIGYLNKRKGVNYLLDAFMQIPDSKARLLIAGTGPVENELKQQSKKDKRIQFFDYVEGEAKANLYAQSDVFILPTLLDVWGLVINEAIHYGLAIICSDAAIAKEIITKRVGKIVAPANVTNLTDAMSGLIQDQDGLKQIQQFNRGNSAVSDVPKAAGGYVAALKASSGNS